MSEKNLQLERTVFFCDAVVAIAITLLALEIKITNTETGHLRFRDILEEWHVFAAFFLSFVNIASFWKTHHTFFSYIKGMDERLLGFNISWLFFIVMLPFTTSLVSNYFFDKPAMLIYSIDIFFIAIFQNMIWDYGSELGRFVHNEEIDDRAQRQLRLYCNLDMINSILAIVISFFSPILAFISLFFKLPVIIFVPIYMRRRPRPRG